MATFVDNLLASARELLSRNPRSGAYKRRAVSSAYYAVFHALAKTCADIHAPDKDIASDLYEKVYRALDHGPLEKLFKGNAFGQNGSLKLIGEQFCSLKEARQKADYLPPRQRVFTQKQCEEHIQNAENTVAQLRALSHNDRRVLAILILFAKR